MMPAVDSTSQPFSTKRWLIAFTLLFVFYLPSLWLPPNHDQAKGLWYEAVFLARTDFDYVRLLRDEQSFCQGGALIYGQQSILPSFIALLMQWTPASWGPILIYRLIVLSAGAYLVVSVYDLVRERTDARTALFVAAVFATYPSVMAQFELLGMEVLLCAFTFAGIKSAIGPRPYLSPLFLALALACKMTALLGVVVLLGYLIVRALLSWWAGDKRDARIRLVTSAGILVVSFFWLLVVNIMPIDHQGIRPVRVPLPLLPIHASS